MSNFHLSDWQKIWKNDKNQCFQEYIDMYIYWEMSTKIRAQEQSGIIFWGEILGNLKNLFL